MDHNTFLESRKFKFFLKCVKISIILHADNSFTLNHFYCRLFIVYVFLCVDITYDYEQHSPITKVVGHLLLFLLTFPEHCICFLKYVLYFRDLSS